MALLQAIVLLSIAAAGCNALLNTFEESKVVGGKTTHVQDAPFMVQVLTGEGSSVTTCGGTLVSPTHVLTAAHCVPTSSKLAGNLQVLLATSEFYATGKTGDFAQVKAFRAHPKYQVLVRPIGNETGVQYAIYDVAVIKLSKAVATSAKVKPITITKAGVQAKEGALVSVAGWGLYNNKKNPQASKKLRIARIPVLKRAQCQQQLGKAFTPQEFCISSSLSSAFCTGDSGGPAFIGNVQYGVVSWGSCGQLFPDVIANLADPEVNSFVQKMIKTL